jgi:hypothetical protein
MQVPELGAMCTSWSCASAKSCGTEITCADEQIAADSERRLHVRGISAAQYPQVFCGGGPHIMRRVMPEVCGVYNEGGGIKKR